MTIFYSLMWRLFQNILLLLYTFLLLLEFLMKTLWNLCDSQGLLTFFSHVKGLYIVAWQARENVIRRPFKYSTRPTGQKIIFLAGLLQSKEGMGTSLQLPPSWKWQGSNLLIFAFLRKQGIKHLVALFKKKYNEAFVFAAPLYRGTLGLKKGLVQPFRINRFSCFASHFASSLAKGSRQVI